jgi:Zn-dependent membrane protease YugP
MKLLRFPIFMILSFLSLPLFPLWGPFACFYLAKSIARRAIESSSKIHPALAAFAAQLVLFTPIVVSSSGGISLIFPWWTVLLLKPSDHVDGAIGFFAILLFLPISFDAARRARRQIRAHSLPDPLEQAASTRETAGGGTKEYKPEP